jgi:GT2 family glycosyltransferase
VTTPVDAVIVAFRSDGVIERSVRAAQRLGGRVVVVDHGDGQSARRAAAMGATTVHDPANPGFGAGQNRGVSGTTTPYVLVCNPDAGVDPAAVLAGADFLEARPDVGAVQGVVVNQRTGAPERSQGVAVGPGHLLGRAVGARRLLSLGVVRHLARCSPNLRDHVERVPPRPLEVESLAATVLLVRRAAFDAVGGFDPTFFLYGEDLDLCRRLRRAGWALVALPEVWAVHEGGGSAESARVRELHWWRGTMQYGARWWSPAEWTVALVAAAIRATRLSIRSLRCSRPAWSSLVLSPVHDRLSRRPAS